METEYKICHRNSKFLKTFNDRASRLKKYHLDGHIKDLLHSLSITEGTNESVNLFYINRNV